MGTSQIERRSSELIKTKIVLPPPENAEEAKVYYDIYLEVLAYHQAQAAMIEMETLPKLRKLMK